MRLVKVFLLIILILSMFNLVNAGSQVVIINSDDWHDLYLGAVYAGSIGADVMFFRSLAEVQRKTETLGKWSDIIVIESKENSVYETYSNYLDNKKINNYQVLMFDDYTDLQDKLFLNADYNKFVLLNSDFGVEALALSPLIIKENYAPLFIDRDNYKSVLSNIKHAEDIIIGGKLINKIRSKIDLDPSEEFSGYYNQNVNAISEFIANKYGSEWAVLASPENYDLTLTLQKNPLLLYLGGSEELAEVIKNSNINKLEVGGNALADLSKNIEKLSGKDLKILVKYGQTITNLPGYEGKILDIDSVKVNFPFVKLDVQNVVYFKNQSILVVGVENQGNVDALAQFSVEFGNKIYSSDGYVLIPENQLIYVPFEVRSSDSTTSNIDVRYDYSDDFRFSIKASNGKSVIKKNVTLIDVATPSDIDIAKVSYSDGRILVEYDNDNSFDIKLRSELYLKNELIASSKEYIVPANSKESVILYVPYNSYDDFRSFETKVKTIYGKENTLFVREDVVKVDSVSNLIPYLVLVLVFVVIFLLIFLLVRKKKTKKHR